MVFVAATVPESLRSCAVWLAASWRDTRPKMWSRPASSSTTRARTPILLFSSTLSATPDSRMKAETASSRSWKRLASHLLMRADVLLLDEPTNHLDVANVAWLQEYLKKHTEITSLIVSHDSGFLDAVCTDIYHYEQKKLVSYKGNLADFVRVKPEAKSYYTLSDSQVQFKFPPPGILTGVKSNTRSILRMSNCTFTYPGSSKPSLSEASCNLSLSSRVAIIGANGAGKSTLIKILTGEVIPQEGKVEKHPNLRIGYIKPSSTLRCTWRRHPTSTFSGVTPTVTIVRCS
jgi:elongation factor 3